MKRIELLVVLLLLIAVGITGCTETGKGAVNPDGYITPTVKAPPVIGVQWEADWMQASNRAEADNKPVMINFYTDVCPTCRRLDRDTFANAEMSAFLNDNFIPLKSNAGRTNLYMSYGVRYVPTTVFVEPDGSVITTPIVGYISPEGLYQHALQVLELWQK